MAAALADDFAEIVLRIAVFGNQLLVTQRLFQGIEIRSLHILDNGDLKRCLVIDIANDHWNFDQTGKLRRPPAPFTGNDLIAIDRGGANDDRLYDAMLANGAGKIMQLGLVEIAARIARVAADEFDRDQAIGIDRRSACIHGRRLIHLPDESRQSAPKAPLRKIIIHCRYSP